MASPLMEQGGVWFLMSRVPKFTDDFSESPTLHESGKMRVSTSTVAALFLKMALTDQRIAMVDMLLLVFPSISISTVGVDGARASL